ncbi:MAG: hypothetical protein IID15_00115 [Candidatus Marinimicrobia bacterium]|nr:hypothetical protein [Candidatus Neomarinimicrobiota bacterium]
MGSWLIAALSGQDAMQNGSQAQLPDSTNGQSKYRPAPLLSPNTGRLQFDNIYPGESKTLFMDLANLGVGDIELDSVVIAPEQISVTLPSYRLRPGQFLRFPVTFTQPDLMPRELTLSFGWHSPIFDTRDTLTIVVSAVPGQPLVANPGKIVWKDVLEGGAYQRQGSLINRGKEAIYLGQPTLPSGITSATLPPVIPGGKSAIAKFVWSPPLGGELDSMAVLIYTVAGDTGRLELPLRGIAHPPVRFAQDTLGLDALMAGSRYKRTVTVFNNTDKPASMVLSSVLDEDSTAVAWVRFKSELTLAPGQARELPFEITPAHIGRQHITATYNHRVAVEGGTTEQMPSVKFVIATQVVLPVTAAVRTVPFGLRPVYQTSTEPVRLINRGHEIVKVKLKLAQQTTGAFTVPPLEFTILPGRLLDVPVHFRPLLMSTYHDSILIQYTTFDAAQTVKIYLTGEGEDQPLRKIGRIADVKLKEDFPGWYLVADLSRVFVDPNHGITYRLINPLEKAVHVRIEENQFKIAAQPNHYGTADVILLATNTVGESVADTFNLEIKGVNDLPRLVKPIADIVVYEDAPSRVIGLLSEILVDPDRTVDTIVTDYSIYSAPGGDGITLVRRGDELVLSIAPNWSGSRSFVISAMDPLDTTVTAYDAFSVTVLPVNDPPRLRDLPDLELAEDSRSTIFWAPYISDEDDDPESISLEFMHPEGGRLPLTFIPAGPLQTIVQPLPNWSGKVQVSLVVTDAGGESAGGTFEVTVLPQNDPPLPFKAKGPVTLSVDERLLFSTKDTIITFTWEESDNLDPDDVIIYTWQLLDTTRQKVIDERTVGDALSLDILMDEGGLFYWTVVGRDRAGAWATSDTLLLMMESTAPMEEGESGEFAFGIGPNFPNPFNTSTKIRYQIPRFSTTQLIIYDATGRVARTLIDEPKYRGKYTAIWDGRDDSGRTVASGPYVAELRAGRAVVHLKLVVLH